MVSESVKVRTLFLVKTEVVVINDDCVTVLCLCFVTVKVERLVINTGSVSVSVIFLKRMEVIVVRYGIVTDTCTLEVLTFRRTLVVV